MSIFKKKYIHIIIMFLFTFGIGLLPPFGEMTDYGMDVLGVFIGTLYGWIFIDLLWPSLWGFFALSLTGYTTVLGGLMTAFGNATLVLTIVAAVFAEVLNKLGINQVIAYWLLSKKLFIGKPWLLITSICILSVIMGLLGGSFAAIFLMWSVVQSIAALSGYEKGHRLTSMLLAFILYGVVTGGSVAPFQSAFIMYSGFFSQPTGLTVPALQTVVIGLVYIIATLLIMIFFSKIVFKLDASAFTTTEELCQQYARYKSSRYQKVGLVLLLIYFVGLIIPEIFPTIPLFIFFKTLGIAGFSLLYMFVFCIWKDENGQPIVNLVSCFQNGIPWAVVILMGVTFPLANALEAEEVGFITTVNTLLTPLISHLGATGLILISMFALGIMTQFLHNIVIAALFYPILAPIVINAGGNPYTFFFLVYMALACAYATPAASATAGLIFGHQDVKTGDSYLFGWMFLIVSFLVLLILFPICNIFYPSI